MKPEIGDWNISHKYVIMCTIRAMGTSVSSDTDDDDYPIVPPPPKITVTVDTIRVRFVIT